MNITKRCQEDWIYLNHCIQDKDIGAVKQWFESVTQESKTEIQLFTDIRNPVSLAAVAGDQDIFDILVENGFDPKSPDLLDQDYHRQPVHLASSAGHGDLIKSLLAKHNVNVDTADDRGRTPLHWAAASGESQIVKLLLDSGACVNARQTDNSTPLHIAAESGNGDVCRLLMASKADVNLTDSKGLSPLHYAVRCQPGSAKVPSGAVANHESLC